MANVRSGVPRHGSRSGAPARLRRTSLGTGAPGHRPQGSRAPGLDEPDCRGRGAARRTILYVVPQPGGGALVVVSNLVRTLDRSRFRPIVLLLAAGAEMERLGADLRAGGIEVISAGRTVREPMGVDHKPGGSIGRSVAVRGHRFLARRLRRLASVATVAIPSILRIRSVIRRYRVDLVHANAGLNRPEAVLAARWTGVPCLCHVHMFSVLGFVERSLVRWVSRFIYISRAIETSYLQCGVPSETGVVIHNGIDARVFFTIHDPAEVRRDLRIRGEGPVVAVVGRLDWWKGHEDFVEAMAEVRERVPGVTALIVGEADRLPRNQEYLRGIEGLVAELGLEEDLVFAGARRDIPRVLSAVDVLVVSSSSPEPFGLVVIEGMAAGKPVVATAAGGIPEIIQDGVNGVLVPPRDPHSMASAIEELLQDSGKAARIGSAGRRHVLDRFTIETQSESVRRVYDAVLTPREI